LSAQTVLKSSVPRQVVYATHTAIGIVVPFQHVILSVARVRADNQ